MARRPDLHYTLHPELDTYAYRLMLGGKLEEAEAMFEALAELFPKNDAAFDSLGELYLRKGDKERAAGNFQKALELNPDNTNARAQLDKLKKSASILLFMDFSRPAANFVKGQEQDDPRRDFTPRWKGLFI